MNLRAFALLASLTFLSINCASQKNGSGAWQKSVAESYYNIWSTGIAPAGTGANFIVKLKKTDKIAIKSFTVNGEELEFELKQSETGTLIIGRKYTGPDFEAQNPEMPDFYTQNEYSGAIIISSKTIDSEITISSFERRELEQKHM